MQHTQGLGEISSTQSYSPLIGCTNDQQVEKRGTHQYNPQNTCRTEDSGRCSPYTYTELVPNRSTAVFEASRNIAFPIGYSSSNKMDYSNGMGQYYESRTAEKSRMFGSFQETVRPPLSIPHTATSQYMDLSGNLGHENSTIPCNSSAGIINVQERTEWPVPNNVTPPEQNEMNLRNVELFKNRDEEMRCLREKVDNLYTKMDNIMTKEHYEYVTKFLQIYML